MSQEAVKYFASQTTRNDLPLIRKAISNMISMSEMAKMSISKAGAMRFERGYITLDISDNNSISWRDLTPGRHQSIEFKGVPIKGKGRVDAINGIIGLNKTVEGVFLSELHPSDIIAQGSPYRRAYCAIIAAASLKGLEYPLVSIQLPWADQPIDLAVYVNGAEPYRLAPEVIAEISQGLSQACILTSMSSSNNLLLSIEPAEHEQEIEINPLTTLRLLSESGFSEEQLKLKRKW